MNSSVMHQLKNSQQVDTQGPFASYTGTDTSISAEKAGFTFAMTFTPSTIKKVAMKGLI